MSEEKGIYKTISIRETILFGFCLILAYFAFVKKWDDVQLREDRVRAEEKIKAYEADKQLQHHISDSLKIQVKITEGIVEYQKQNPKIIIEKYDKIRNNINLLSSDKSISFLSAAISKESGNR